MECCSAQQQPTPQRNSHDHQNPPLNRLQKSRMGQHQLLVVHLAGQLDAFEAHVTLTKGPLPLPQGVSNAHQHEDSAIVAVVLLRVRLAHLEGQLLSVETFTELQCVFEDCVFEVDLCGFLEAIVNSDGGGCELGEVPMVAVIDRHQQYITPIDCFLFEVPFYHVFLLVEGCSRKEGVQQLELRILGECLFHEFDVHIDHIVIQPLPVIYPTHGFVGQLLHAFQASLLDLHRVSFLITPDELRALEVIETDEWVILVFFSVLAEPKLSDLCFVIPLQVYILPVC